MAIAVLPIGGSRAGTTSPTMRVSPVWLLLPVSVAMPPPSIVTLPGPLTLLAMP
jgi:hypothetical protein